MMRQSLLGNRKFLWIGIAGVFLLASCKSGFRPEALPLDASHIKDYGNDIKANKVPVEAVTYGQLMPGGEMSARGHDSLRSTYDAVHAQLAKIKGLPQVHDFDESNLLAWARAFEETIKRDCAPLIVLASESPHAAKALAAAIEPYVTSSGLLPTIIAQGKNHVPDSFKAAYQTLADGLANRFDRLYQATVISALSIIQHEASTNLSTIETEHAKLAHALKAPDIIVLPTQKAAAQSTLTEVSNKWFSLSTYVGKMTTNEMVAAPTAAATIDLSTSLTQLKTQFVDQVAPSYQAKINALYGVADAAMKALNDIAVDYPSIEKLKNPADARLLDLVKKLSDVAVVVGAISLNQNTDINHVAMMLSKNNTVVLTRDDSSGLIIEALASAVVHSVAPKFGLEQIDNIVGLNHEAINSAKVELGMSEDQFRVYLISRARLIRESYSKNGAYKNIFVVFADEIQGSYATEVINEFLKEQGKVLVVSSQGSKYAQGAAFFKHDHLNVLEGILLADALIKERDFHVNAHYLSQNLIKTYAGLAKLTLGRIRPLVTAALARSHQGSLDVAINSALEEQGVSLRDVIRSEIKKDSPSVIQQNLSNNHNYYFDKARGL